MQQPMYRLITPAFIHASQDVFSLFANLEQHQWCINLMSAMCNMHVHVAEGHAASLLTLNAASQCMLFCCPAE